MLLQRGDGCRIDEPALLHPAQSVAGRLFCPLQLRCVEGDPREHLLDIERLVAEFDGALHGTICRLPGGPQDVGEQISQPLAAIPADRPHAQGAAEQNGESEVGCGDDFHDSSLPWCRTRPFQCSINDEDVPSPMENKVTDSVLNEGNGRV